MIKPFIYQFLENPLPTIADSEALVEYSAELNLTVLKGTRIAAVCLQQLGTTTLTKADGEGTDSDINRSENYTAGHLSTQTFTRTQQENADSDFHDAVSRISALMDTNTITLVSSEVSDSDNQRLFQQLSTRTLTEASENSDSDQQ